MLKFCLRNTSLSTDKGDMYPWLFYIHKKEESKYQMSVESLRCVWYIHHMQKDFITISCIFSYYIFGV